LAEYPLIIVRSVVCISNNSIVKFVIIENLVNC